MAGNGKYLLDESFFHDLEAQDGMLHPLLERVWEDDTLMLNVLENRFRIFYRGGALSKIERNRDGKGYRATFDSGYLTAESRSAMGSGEKTGIASAQDAIDLVNGFANDKQTMDLFFSKNKRRECEFQQLVARENNAAEAGTSGNASDYFISGQEHLFKGAAKGDVRFDLLAVKWRANAGIDRKNPGKTSLAIIEMKYGNQALGSGSEGSNPGIEKHFDDLKNLLSDGGAELEKIRNFVERQFNTAWRLKLLPGVRKEHDGEGIALERGRPEYILLLANANPRGGKGGKSQAEEIVGKICADSEREDLPFDVRIAVSPFPGYYLYDSHMLTPRDFLEWMAAARKGGMPL
jgi:hypothetical protein